MTPAEHVRARGRVLLAVSSMMLATFLAALDQTVVVTALPRISRELDGFDGLSWIVTAYLVSSTVTIPLYGRLSDVYGRRRLLAIAITLFMVGSAASAAAESVTALIAARALQGLGAGGLLPLSQAAIADLFSPRERGRYQGYIGAVYAAAAVAGPLLGGTLTDLASWRWIFLLNLPLGLLTLFVVLRTMPRRGTRVPQRIDYVGAALLGAGVACMLVACAWAGAPSGLGAGGVPAAGVIAALLLLAFVRWERRTAEPLVPLWLLRAPVLRTTFAGALLLGAHVLAVDVYVPVFVQTVLGRSATVSGLVLMPFSLAWVLTSAVVGRLIAQTGRYRRFPIGGAVLTLAGAAILASISAGTPPWLIGIALTLLGIGMGSAWPVYVVASQNALEHARVGVATAMLIFCRTMGASVGISILGAVLSARLTAELAGLGDATAGHVDVNGLLHGSSVPATVELALASSLRTVFVALLPLAVIALVLAIRLEERPLRSAGPQLSMSA